MSCAAKTWPTTRRARSTCSARSACRCRAICTRRWCCAADGEKLSKQNGAKAVVPGAAPLRGALAALELDAQGRRDCGELLSGGPGAMARPLGPAVADGMMADVHRINRPKARHADHRFRTAVRRHPRRRRRRSARRPAVTVHYTGWLYENGVRAPSSIRARTATTRSSSTSARGMVIRGWDEGVQGMKVGGTRRARHPAAARLRRTRRRRGHPAERDAAVRGRAARRLIDDRATPRLSGRRPAARAA